ncbi:MAG: hypothetical protein IJI14_05020 [Anaerolineaceae bacterium]|nr:hypothetical protein [Anaerolineaceae bacterium]
MIKKMFFLLVVLLSVFSVVYAEQEPFSEMKDGELFVMSDYYLFPFGTSQDEIMEKLRPFQSEDGRVRIETELVEDSVDGNMFSVDIINEKYEYTNVAYFFDSESKKLYDVMVISDISNKGDFDLTKFKHSLYKTYKFSDADIDEVLTGIDKDMHTKQKDNFPDMQGIFSKKSFVFDEDNYAIFYSDNIIAEIEVYKNTDDDKSISIWIAEQ